MRHDLASAWMVYNERLKDVEDIIKVTSERFFLKKSLTTGALDMPGRELEKVRKTYGLDILTLTDRKGLVIARTRNPYNLGDDQSNDTLVSRALKGNSAAATQIVPVEQLRLEGDGLAEKAYTVFKETPKAKPTGKKHETSGIMLKAAVPVTDDNGDLIGETKGKILVVDDEPDVVDMLRMMLENASYEVVSAYDGKEGIEKAKQEKPDAIVLDLMMPGMDGFEACKEMKNDPDLKDIPVLVLTAISRHFSDTKYARSLGLGLVSDDYIDKPVDPNVLLNRIAGLLGKL